MKLKTILANMAILWACTAPAQDFSTHLASPGGIKPPRIGYGNQSVIPVQKSTRYDLLTGIRETTYETSEPSSLKIRVVSQLTFNGRYPQLRHEVELSSSKKLTEDLTIHFPVGSLENLKAATIPRKNGLIGHLSELTGSKIASYRCAGRPEKYPNDLALPLVLVGEGQEKTAVMTDPFFTSLFDTGEIRWTYPKEVGLEDAVERRTIIEMAGITNMDEGMNGYYQTILRDVPPGPEWMKEIAMISYDYMSDMGRGWYNDIDTLATLIAPADRHKVALCLHGWYDVVGRYCFNEKTGKLDPTWTNRIRGIDLSLENLHHRIRYAKDRGFTVLMYFADGLLSSKGLPGFDPENVFREGGWNGPDVVGGPYSQNLAQPAVGDFYRNYARALFTEFAGEVSGFVWDETFYIQTGTLGVPKHPGYLDRAHMRLIREVAAILHSIAPDRAFFASDCIGEKSGTGDVPPYALMADGCYQDSWSEPSYWSYGIFPNYRNVIWSCNWRPITNFKYTVFGVLAYNTPVVFTNGWENDRGFSEMTSAERNDFISLFNYRRQKRTHLQGLEALPPYYEFQLPLWSTFQRTATMQEALVMKTDSEVAGFEGSKAIDGDPGTFWHTPWSGEIPGYPHLLDIDLGRETAIKGYRLLPRSDGITGGWISKASISVSNDGKSWGEPVVTSTFPKDQAEKQVLLRTTVRARYVRLTAINGFDGQPFASVAEFRIIAEGED
jgi:hypothetical protein